MTKKTQDIVTVYVMGGFGLHRTIGKLVRIFEKPWAQYPMVPFVELVPLGKRKPIALSGGGFQTYLVVVRGEGPVVSDPLAELSNDTETGVRCSKSRYSSFHPQWTVEADAFVKENFAFVYPVLADYRHTIPVEEWRRYDANGRSYRRFIDCATDFCQAIRELADANGRTVEFVYGVWRDYSHQCDLSDQSAVLGEFVQWYGPKLAQPVAASV